MVCRSVGVWCCVCGMVCVVGSVRFMVRCVSPWCAAMCSVVVWCDVSCRVVLCCVALGCGCGVCDARVRSCGGAHGGEGTPGRHAARVHCIVRYVYSIRLCIDVGCRLSSTHILTTDDRMSSTVSCRVDIACGRRQSDCDCRLSGVGGPLAASHSNTPTSAASRNHQLYSGSP